MGNYIDTASHPHTVNQKSISQVNPMALYLTFALTLFIVTSVHAGRVLITIYALKLGAQPFTVGVLAALFSVLPTLLAWQVGRYSDRFGSRWLLIGGTAGGVLGMLLPYLFPGLPALYAAAVMNGLLFALAGGAPLQNLVGILSRARGQRQELQQLQRADLADGLFGAAAGRVLVRSYRPRRRLRDSGAAVADPAGDSRSSGAASCPAARARPPMPEACARCSRNPGSGG